MTREIHYKKIFRALELYGKQSLIQQFGCNSKNNGISLTNKIHVCEYLPIFGLNVSKCMVNVGKYVNVPWIRHG